MYRGLLASAGSNGHTSVTLHRVGLEVQLHAKYGDSLYQREFPHGTSAYFSQKLD